MPITTSDLDQILANNPSLRIKRENRPVHPGKPIPCPETLKQPQRAKARRNRYSEQSGELGIRVRESLEQLRGSIRLWLPYPPSTNSRLANVKGRMLKSAEARSYQDIVRRALTGLKPLTGNLDVSIVINRPQRRGDIDNVLKNCLDSLSGLAFVDDEQVARLTVRRFDGEVARENPGLQIQIKQIAY
jgi:Holliday junction resolvase RusA-like endonuclease